MKVTWDASKIALDQIVSVEKEVYNLQKDWNRWEEANHRGERSSPEIFEVIQPVAPHPSRAAEWGSPATASRRGGATDWGIPTVGITEGDGVTDWGIPAGAAPPQRESAPEGSHGQAEFGNSGSDSARRRLKEDRSWRRDGEESPEHGIRNVHATVFAQGSPHREFFPLTNPRNTPTISGQCKCIWDR